MIGLVILFKLDSAIFCKISDTKVICKRARQCGERAIDQRSCLRQHPRAAVSPRASLTFQPGKATQTTGVGECPNARLVYGKIHEKIQGLGLMT